VHKLNFFHIFYIFHPVWITFCTEDVPKYFLGYSEFVKGNSAQSTLI